jgi:hypothetical protein
VEYQDLDEAQLRKLALTATNDLRDNFELNKRARGVSAQKIEAQNQAKKRQPLN